MSDDELPRAGVAYPHIADRELLDGLFARDSIKLVREFAIAPRPIPKIHLEPSDWRAGYLEVHDRERTAELDSDLKELTPQAILRDLYRPVHNKVGVTREPFSASVDWGGREALAEVRRALERQPVERLPSSIEIICQEQRRRRAFLHEPWQPHLPDSAPRPEVIVHREPSMNY